MDLSKLKPAEGATKKEKRIGRGQGSGRGGTSTKGHKGQKAQAGYNHKRGFEGGQTTTGAPCAEVRLHQPHPCGVQGDQPGRHPDPCREASLKAIDARGVL
jgi:hypothetical protein